MSITPAKSGIQRIKPHMVGGSAKAGKPVGVFLNSNESAYGASPSALEAVRSAASGLERYFEFADDHLAPLIGQQFGLNPAQITIGQGSDDLLARLARGYLGPGTELVRTANGYLKVPNYAYANDAEVISVPDEGFKPSVDGIIAAISEKTRIVYLANPENPAGTYLTGEEVRRIHAATPENALLVLDCAYEEYVDALDYEPGEILVGEADNVVMCRTFSKIYGLAGARVGWAYGPLDVIDTVKRIALTFPIASTSAAAVRSALLDQEHIRNVYTENLKNRKWLTEELEKLGLEVVPSQTNFLLVRVEHAEHTAESVDLALQAHGIAIRRFAAPAYRDYIRITLGFPHELRKLMDAMNSILKGAE
ncbi:pyridoxal phosphate-dependent aminotransferase [Cochlodiniinecator piscidefendens]|uniref:pyridoxal phosphate-dependent aminotransferase n=1 Tax=Cochlodiniinecator piscidefendens TaxID=2715756 RepID=UPI00140C3C06|nr:histidinol-phosphate transaminase [Cochlodiniinecator piscidefendens]